MHLIHFCSILDANPSNISDSLAMVHIYNIVQNNKVYIHVEGCHDHSIVPDGAGMCATDHLHALAEPSASHE